METRRQVFETLLDNAVTRLGESIIAADLAMMDGPEVARILAKVKDKWMNRYDAAEERDLNTEAWLRR